MFIVATMVGGLNSRGISFSLTSCPVQRRDLNFLLNAAMNDFFSAQLMT